MAAQFKSPLTLYVLWHPKFSDGEKLADRLFRTLSRNVKDPFSRTIGIPVYYRSAPANSGSEKPAPILLEESDYNAIVVFVDSSMLLSDDWTDYVKEILEKMKQYPDKTRVFPMANDFTSFRSKQLGAINYIRMFEADDKPEFGTFEEEIVGVDDSAIRELAAGLEARESQLQAREAALAERERELSARAASPGVSMGVSQPAVQGHGIHINITIHNSDSGAAAGQVAAPHRTASGAEVAHGATAANRVDVTERKAGHAAAPHVAAPATSLPIGADEIYKRRENFMMSKLAHELCRLLNSMPMTTDEGTTVSPAPLNLFLSHAKADGADIAKEIKVYIESDSAMKTFFDANDIAAGYNFDEEIKGRIEKSALICIQTDYYATREWCLFEVIMAKRFDRPVVVLNAVRELEPRSFPYIGNVPTLRWNPADKARLRRVVDLALFEVLDNTYSNMFQQALLSLYKLPRTHTVGHAPELFTILRLREAEKKNGNEAGSSEGTRYIIYPDPPLGDEEIKLLQDLSPELRFITPTMLPLIEYQVSSK